MNAIFANQKIDGGGNQSPREIANHIGYDLIDLNNPSWKLIRAKRQVWYMNDDIYHLQGKDFNEFRVVLDSAEDIKIVFNFVIAGAFNHGWLTNYPVSKIIFLNSIKESEWKSKTKNMAHSLIPTEALLPPIGSGRFKDIKRVKSDKLRIGRHSRISLKYPADPCELYERIDKKSREFSFMIAHPEIIKRFPHFKFYGWNEIPVQEYLQNIDIYLCLINQNTKEQGGRSNMEAMAAGCCVIVEDRDGPKEYIKHMETGIKIKNVSEIEVLLDYLEQYPDKIEEIGGNARRYALNNFNTNRWDKALTGNAPPQKEGA